MKISFTSSAALAVRSRVQAMQSALPSLLLRHINFIDFLLLAAGLLVGAYLVITLLFIDPEVSQEAPVRTPALAEEPLDTMELWIEEQQDALKAGMKLPSRSVFTTNEQSQ